MSRAERSLLKKLLKYRGFSLQDFTRMILTVLHAVFFLPGLSFATQLHSNSEGIITHQAGHLFFLVSMVILIFAITDKGLSSQKGWRYIQFSAFVFILWNLSTITTHLLDNQMHLIRTETIADFKIKLIMENNSALLSEIYYVLKLDHLLCVPAMLLLYLGLSNLVLDKKNSPDTKKENMS